jgi:D-3-phosphoglycerate dehydrogenase
MSRAPRSAARRTADAGAVDSLVLDLLEWIGAGSRPYAEVMDAWRTSCPRLPVWESAGAQGFIARRRGADGTALISLSARGRAHVRARRSG